MTAKRLFETHKEAEEFATASLYKYHHIVELLDRAGNTLGFVIRFEDGSYLRMNGESF
jgi:hypothetical protein